MQLSLSLDQRDIYATDMASPYGYQNFLNAPRLSLFYTAGWKTTEEEVNEISKFAQ